jgi:hypothetical protein
MQAMSQGGDKLLRLPDCDTRFTVAEGNLEVKLPTIWTDRKARGGKSQRGEEQKRKDQRRVRVRRKKMQAREKAEKSRFIVSFQ